MLLRPHARLPGALSCACRIRPFQRELVAIGVLVLVAVVVLAPLTLFQEIPRGYDTDAFYAPFGAYLHAQLSQGNLPLWNPHAFAGQPFAADPQSGALYPPALLAYGFLDAPHALVALTTFHYLIAVTGAYAVARLIGANRVGSIYAGLAYGVSGPAVRTRAGARAALGRRLDPRLHRRRAARRAPARAARAGGRAPGCRDVRSRADRLAADHGGHGRRLRARPGRRARRARRHRRARRGSGRRRARGRRAAPPPRVRAALRLGRRGRRSLGRRAPVPQRRAHAVRAVRLEAVGDRDGLRRRVHARAGPDRARPERRHAARADRARRVRADLGVRPRRPRAESRPADPRHRRTRAGARASR